MAYTLTKIDIAALRKAERIFIHCDGGNPERSRLELIKERTEKELASDPFADRDARVCLPLTTDDYTLSGYSYNGSLSSYFTAEQKRNIKAFAHISLYRSQATEEATIVDSLRVGDEIRVEFIAGCDSEMMTKHGITCDECRLHVTRNGKQMQYLLRYEISEIWSTARMIRGLPAKPTREERAA